MNILKIFSIVIVFSLFANVVNASNINKSNILKERNLKSIFSFWKANQVNKYKHLAPKFPKELPVEESITVFFKNITSPFSQIKDENNESVAKYIFLAPTFTKEIPVDEEISINTNNTSIDNNEILTNYDYLAPVFPNEIPVEE